MHRERIMAWCWPCVSIHFASEVICKKVSLPPGAEIPDYVQVLPSGQCRTMICKRTGWEIAVSDYFLPPLVVEVPDEGEPAQMSLFDEEALI